ncbi:hypothetical protein ACFL30_00520 [Candidatus Latescibacterota bacterium]
MLYRNAKSMGMGNTKVAGGFTYNGFINNPALLKHVKKLKFCVVRLPVTINDSVYDFANFINEESNNIINYGDLEKEGKKSLINEIIKREGTWGRLIFSPMFDLAVAIGRHRIGLAGFATNRIGIKMDRGIYEPRIYGKGSSTVALVLGYARPLDKLTPGLNAGVNMKFLQRHSTNAFHLRARDIGNIMETSKPIYEEYKKKTINLFVFDVGMLYEIPSINSFAGATVQFLGMGDYTSVDLGFTRQMMRKRLAVSVDYIDFLDNNKENIFKKIHAGAEYRYLFFAIRGGINSGYPTVGLGVNFKIVDLDFAIYSEEMSKRPGALREDRYMVQMKFGW